MTNFKIKFTVKQGKALLKILKSHFKGYCVVDCSVRGYQDKPEVVYEVYVAELDESTKQFDTWVEAVTYVFHLTNGVIKKGEDF